MAIGPVDFFHSKQMLSNLVSIEAITGIKHVVVAFSHISSKWEFTLRLLMNLEHVCWKSLEEMMIMSYKYSKYKSILMQIHGLDLTKAYMWYLCNSQLVVGDIKSATGKDNAYQTTDLTTPTKSVHSYPFVSMIPRLSVIQIRSSSGKQLFNRLSEASLGV